MARQALSWFLNLPSARHQETSSRNPKKTQKYREAPWSVQVPQASENRRTASKPLHKSMLTTAWMATRGQEAEQPINKARNLQIVLWEGSTVAACCSTNHITSTVSAVSVIFWSASITSITSMTGSAPSPPQALGVPQPIRCPGKSSVPCFQMFPGLPRHGQH